MPVYVRFKNWDSAYLFKSAACKKLVVPLITFIFDIAQINKTKTWSNSHTFAAAAKTLVKNNFKSVNGLLLIKPY